jgi:hypothetical protein
MPVDDEPVELARFPSEPLAAVLVARLEAEGIKAAVLGGHIKNANLFFALTLWPAVVVRQADLERARRVMAEIGQPEDGHPEGGDGDWEDEAERAPREDADL